MKYWSITHPHSGRLNWGERTHHKHRWHHPMGWVLDLNQSKLSTIMHLFLLPDYRHCVTSHLMVLLSWLLAQGNSTFKLQVKLNPHFLKLLLVKYLIIAGRWTNEVLKSNKPQTSSHVYILYRESLKECQHFSPINTVSFVSIKKNFNVASWTWLTDGEIRSLAWVLRIVAQPPA